MSPVKTRDKLKEREQQIQGALDRALFHISEMKQTYGDNYPVHTQALDTFAMGILHIKDAVQLFRTTIL